MIRPGDLRHRVTLQRRVEALDGYGQGEPTWNDAGTFWAFVRPLQGREAEAAKQIKPELSHRVTLRYQPGVAFTAGDRLLFGVRVLNVDAVKNLGERNIELELDCIETPGELA